MIFYFYFFFSTWYTGEIIVYRTGTITLRVECRQCIKHVCRNVFCSRIYNIYTHIYTYIKLIFFSAIHIICTRYIYFELTKFINSLFSTGFKWTTIIVIMPLRFERGHSSRRWSCFWSYPQIIPALATVSLNGQTELRCMTSSSSDGPHSITWYKDGRVMAGRAQRDVLRLVSVSRSDCGIYQCLVRRGDGETAQSAAAVRLGGECMYTVHYTCAYLIEI